MAGASRTKMKSRQSDNSNYYMAATPLIYSVFPTFTFWRKAYGNSYLNLTRRTQMSWETETLNSRIEVFARSFTLGGK